MNKQNDEYLAGVRAAIAFCNSKQYGGFDEKAPAESIIKLFQPPVVEYLTQVSSPLPKPRKDWIKGFNDERVAIFTEREQQ